jgi:hypothetical protein
MEHDENNGLQGFPAGAVQVSPPPPEFVARGLIWATGAVVVGVVLTIILWRVGFIASITSFILAAGAGFLYMKGAGAPPRRGVVPLVLLILVGVAIGFFGVIASDAWDAYDKLGLAGTQSRMSFIGDNVFRGEVIKSYGGDMAMYFVFAALGIFSTLRRLLTN